MKFSLSPILLAVASSRSLRGLESIHAETATVVDEISKKGADNCYIHSSCDTGKAGWSDDSNNTFGVGWYCNDGQAVDSSSDFDRCNSSMQNCISGAAKYIGNEWTCDGGGGDTADELGYCPATGDPSGNDGDLCGFTQDPWTELSCSMYAYRPMASNKAEGFSPLDNPKECSGGAYLDIMANGKNYGEKDNLNPQTNAWAANFDGTENSEYFVFHGCDGAGLQSDCVGDIKYVEHFGARLNWDRDSGRIVDGHSVGKPFTEAYPDGICEQVADRTHCKMVHPGTETVYDSYYGGWWGSDAASDSAFSSKGMGSISPDQMASTASGPWSGSLAGNILKIPERSFRGKHPFADEGEKGKGELFSFMLFPLAKWAREGAAGNYFSYPSVSASNVKLYVDNEPGSVGYPPNVQVYFGVLTKSADAAAKDVIKMLRWDSDADGNIKLANAALDKPTVLYPVHKGDGSNVPY